MESMSRVVQTVSSVFVRSTFKLKFLVKCQDVRRDMSSEPVRLLSYVLLSNLHDRVLRTAILATLVASEVSTIPR